MGAMQASGLGSLAVKDVCSGGQGSSAETHYHQPVPRLSTPSWVWWSVSALLGWLPHTLGHGSLKHVQ